MRFPLFLPALLGTVLLAAGPAPAAEPMSKEAVEQIVKDYLLREPEVVYQALQALQAKRDAESAEQQADALTAHKSEVFTASGDPAVGSPSGDVTLVEFFDYHCGYCRQMVPAVQQLLRDDGRLRLVLKEFPILGPDSVTASKAALAAERQGKYREMHFALLAAPDLSLASVLRIAKAQGLDTDRLQSDMESAAIKNKLAANLQLAQALGIEGTPAFALGDRLIPGAVGHDQLAALIGEQRASAAN